MVKKNNHRLIIISFLLALPFWWGINVLHGFLEDFFYLKAIATYDLTRASLVFDHDPIRNSKVPYFQTTAKSALSVFVPFKGKEQVLFKKYPETLLPIASITKLMTANIILENYDLKEKVKISQEAIDQLEDFGQLKVGKVFPVEYLLYPLLMESSNDAAFALADDYPGMSESYFLNLMNEKASLLEMKDTSFFSASGLDPDKNEPKNNINISTANDLLKLIKSLIEKELIWEILSTKYYSEYGPVLSNTNILLEKIPGLIGGKTGYTSRAKGCMVLLTKAPKNKGYIINIILGSNNRFKDMENLAKWTKQGYNW